MEKVLHSQMPFTTGGQTVNDRLTAAYHSLAGSQLGKTVCKATTEEMVGPKKKHLDYLLHCTHEPNVSIPQLANSLIERTTNSNWCVVFKSLITIHNLMCYGNERFSQYLASSNANFELGNFFDKQSIHGYDMSVYLRRYARYITEKIYTYRMMAFDFCKIKRGREDGLLRTMPTDRLLKTLPLLQGQTDALLGFQIQPQELTNGVVNSCFILLFRDLVRLFACYNDGVINLLEKYFDMNKKQCREALDLYKNFLTRVDKVSEFLKVAEEIGISRSEIPDLAKAPSSLLEALEQHLNALEGGKITPGTGSGSRLTSPATVSATRTAIENLSTFQEPGYVDATNLDEATKRKLLEEEQERMNMLKEQRLRELELTQAKRENTQPQPTNSSFLSSPSASSQQFKASDDLLSLDIGPSQAPPPSSTNPFVSGSSVGASAGVFGAQLSPQTPFGASAWGTSSVAFPAAATATNGHQYQQQVAISANGFATGPFASDENFAKAFGGSASLQQVSSGPDPFGDMLTPVPSFGGVQPPQRPASTTSAPGLQQPKKTDGKLVTGDLESSLACLAENLNISKGQEALRSKPIQWGGGPAKTQQQTGAGVMASAGGGPMGAPMCTAGPAVAGAWGAAYPQTAPGVWGGAPMAAYGQPRPMYGGPMGMGSMQTSGVFGQQPQRMANPQDPFGAL